MSSDVPSSKNSLDEITLAMEYLSLRGNISTKKETRSLNAMKIAYDNLQKLKQPSTPEDLKACIDMSKSPHAKFLEMCITSLILDSRNSVILDKIFDDIPCVLQLLLKRMYRLPCEEVNDFWRLLEALCTSSERIGTIASCFAHHLAAEYLKPEYRGCVDQMSLAVFTARTISISREELDSRGQKSLDKISSSFFEGEKLYAPGIRYTLRCMSVRERLTSFRKIEFTPDSNLIDCAHTTITMLTNFGSDASHRNYVMNFASLLKSSTFINDLGPKFSCLRLSGRKDREMDDKNVLVDLFLNLREREILSDYSLFLPLLITWIQDGDFNSKTQKLDRAVFLLLRILQLYTASITPSQCEVAVTALLSLMETYPPGSEVRVSWIASYEYLDRNIRAATLEVIDSVMGHKALSPNQKERLLTLYKQSDFQKELPDRIFRQIFG